MLGNVNAPPEACVAHEQTRGFPYEIVEIIIAHLVRDLYTLKACSLTCRSWYTVVVSHIHHTLVLEDKFLGTARDGLRPLSKLHKLGLIPHVKENWLGQGSPPWFEPQEFSPHDLRYLSAFTNVHTLKLRHLEIYRFVPGVGRYFGHFSPTLRSIILFEPCCTPRQLSYFLSFFTNLDNIDIVGCRVPQSIRTFQDPELVLFSTKKLRGRLSLGRFNRDESWTYPIASCGGLRFHYMDLYRVEGCGPILLEACAETLETLRFHLTGGLVG